jgi:hypothetical protein
MRSPARRVDNERIAQLVEFGAAVCRVHVVGTAYGTHRLADYFGAMAGAWRPRIRAA